MTRGLASGDAFFGYLFHAQLVAGKPQLGDFGSQGFYIEARIQ